MESIIDLIKARHSVRNYLDKAVEKDKINEINKLISLCNKEGHLNIQLVLNDSSAFDKFILHYGRLRGANNYLAIIGKKSNNLDECAGYYGEKIVLKLQELGLNSCWVGGTYKKGAVKAKIGEGEKLVCVIAFGYGATQGVNHKSKGFDDVSIIKEAPDWYKKGIEYALLAPTALNQQKFKFNLLDDNIVVAKPGIGALTKVDLGIVKYHFELGAGTENFKWG